MGDLTGSGELGSALTWLDWAVFIVLGASTLLAAIRGLVREVASFAIWICAIALGWQLAPLIVDALPSVIPSDQLRFSVGFVGVIIVVTLVGRLVASALQALIDAAGVRPIDRLMGMLFGLLRGCLIILIVGMLAMMTAIAQQAFWQQARTRPWIEAGVAMTKPWLPGRFADLLKFEGER